MINLREPRTIQTLREPEKLDSGKLRLYSSNEMPLNIINILKQLA